jgi:hypothetical protein
VHQANPDIHVKKKKMKKKPENEGQLSILSAQSYNKTFIEL